MAQIGGRKKSKLAGLFKKEGGENQRVMMASAGSLLVVLAFVGYAMQVQNAPTEVLRDAVVASESLEGSGLKNDSSEAETYEDTVESVVEETSLEQEAKTQKNASVKLLVVDVDGAVLVPGVYTLSDGSRVIDAISAAGGLGAGADTTGINQATAIADGDKVYVPKQGEAVPVQTAGAAGSSSGVIDTSASDDSAQIVNLNSATADQLMTLSGIGPKTAANIIKDRQTNGPFASVEDLMRVSGIGEKTLEGLKDSLVV